MWNLKLWNPLGGLWKHTREGPESMWVSWVLNKVKFQKNWFWRVKTYIRSLIHDGKWVFKEMKANLCGKRDLNGEVEQMLFGPRGRRVKMLKSRFLSNGWTVWYHFIFSRNYSGSSMENELGGGGGKGVILVPELRGEGWLTGWPGDGGVGRRCWVQGLLLPEEAMHVLYPSQSQQWNWRAWNWGGKGGGALGRLSRGDLLWEGHDGSLNREDQWPREEVVVRRDFTWLLCVLLASPLYWPAWNCVLSPKRREQPRVRASPGSRFCRGSSSSACWGGVGMASDVEATVCSPLLPPPCLSTLHRPCRETQDLRHSAMRWHCSEGRLAGDSL